MVQANYELRSLSHIASHDIKGPLKNIGNFLGLIKRKIPANIIAGMEMEFSFIDTGFKQVYTFLDDFTQYINVAKMDWENAETVDLNEVMEDIKHNLLVSEKHKGKEVMLHELSAISSNRSALYFIFKNFVENGLKYNLSDLPTVEVSQKETADEIQILVKDNGIGFEEKYKEKIFKMHVRLQNNSQFEGTGLGLAIVHVLCKKIKGRIDVESEVGKGSLFTLSLPKKLLVAREEPVLQEVDLSLIHI